ncbi:MAG: hypothetical protein AAFN74_01780 [Myxococcota bacterium]
MNGVNGAGNPVLTMLLQKLDEKDASSSKSQNFRDAMQAMQNMALNPEALLGLITQIAGKVLPLIAGKGL